MLISVVAAAKAEPAAFLDTSAGAVPKTPNNRPDALPRMYHVPPSYEPYSPLNAAPPPGVRVSPGAASEAAPWDGGEASYGAAHFYDGAHRPPECLASPPATDEQSHWAGLLDVPGSQLMARTAARDTLMPFPPTPVSPPSPHQYGHGTSPITMGHGPGAPLSRLASASDGSVATAVFANTHGSSYVGKASHAGLGVCVGMPTGLAHFVVNVPSAGLTIDGMKGFNVHHTGNYKYMNTIEDARLFGGAFLSKAGIAKNANEANKLLGKDVKSFIQLAFECGRGPAWIMQNCPYAPPPSKSLASRAKRARAAPASQIAAMMDDQEAVEQQKRVARMRVDGIPLDMAAVRAEEAASAGN
ncbi:hypothetical protein M885DRAFT_573563 [Pelagophyceae sp. CCMP2097]|nr:hypothetical protein M885DRAFT_573563 [Pelagophyceae sp. CCMP2097]